MREHELEQALATLVGKCRSYGMFVSGIVSQETLSSTEFREAHGEFARSLLSAVEVMEAA